MITNKLIFLLIIFFNVNQLRAGIRKVTILQTTDIHCELDSWRRDTPHGWLKLGSLITSERKKAGADKTILIDCGDTIQGSLIGSFTKGAVAVKLLNRLKYDFWVIGNHELDYGLDQLNKRIKEVKAIPLLANISYPHQSKKFIPWKLIHKNGTRIAIIGMGCPDIFDRIWKEKLRGMEILSIEESLGQTLPSIMRAKPDMIILAMHHGLYGAKKSSGNYIPSIIRKYPQIDLVLGGHFHQEEPGKKIGLSTLYAQSGSHGKYLLRAVASIDTSKHQVTNISSRLISVKKSTRESITMKEAIKQESFASKKYGWRKIGKLSHDLHPLNKRKSNSQLSEFYSKAIASQTGADIVLQSSGSDYTLNKGDLTEWDLFRAYPFEDSICLLDMTKQQFTEIIEEQLIQVRDKRFLSPYGLTIIIDTNNKIKQCILGNGKIWDDNSRQTVAINSYSLAGAGRRFPILQRIALMPGFNSRDTKITLRDAVRAYMRNTQVITIRETQRIRTKK